MQRTELCLLRGRSHDAGNDYATDHLVPAKNGPVLKTRARRAVVGREPHDCLYARGA